MGGSCASDGLMSINHGGSIGYHEAMGDAWALTKYGYQQCALRCCTLFYFESSRKLPVAHGRPCGDM